MTLLYPESKTLVKGNSAEKISSFRQSRNPFNGLSDEDAEAVKRTDAIFCSRLSGTAKAKFEALGNHIPFEQVKHHLRLGYLAETLFRKQIKEDGLVYEELMKAQCNARRERARAQATVDLVSEGVLPASALDALPKPLPTASKKSRRGRSRFSMKTMFLIVVLGCRFRLSDEALHQWLCESSIARHFVELHDIRKIPSPKTIWFYREAWAQQGSLSFVYQQSLQFCLEALPDVAPMVGQYAILDGSFVEARKRHVTSEVHKMILEGKDPVEIFANPAVRRQVDTQARHTKKNGLTYFGFKIHAKVCAITKLIIDAFVTPANVHDSQGVERLVTEADKGCVIYADSAYNGQKQRQHLERLGAIHMFMEKPSVIKKLADKESLCCKQMAEIKQFHNQITSKTRVRIEHVFGHIQTAFGGSFVRSVTQPRAEAYQYLTACCYNAYRTRLLLTQQSQP